MFGLGGFETILITWLFIISIITITMRSTQPLIKLLPTFVGLLLLTVAYWFAPWLSFNPHRYLFNYFDPIWSEIAAEAGISLIDWFGPDAIKNILATTGQILNLNAPLLAVILPTAGVSLRFLLGFVFPALMFFITVRLIAGSCIIATHAQIEPVRKGLAIAQATAAIIVLTLLLWAIPEIDAWGYPTHPDAGLALLTLSPEMGAGPWIALAALTLVIGGGIYETLTPLAETYHSKKRGLIPSRYKERQERVRQDNAKPKRRYR